MFKKLLILSTLVVLTGCMGSTTSSSGGNTPVHVSTSGIMIDPMTSVPVINGSSTQGTLYIHNYSDQAISGLNYSLNNSTIKSQMKSLLSRAGFNISGGIEDSNGFVLLNPERCQSIGANSSCAINFTTPSLSLGNQGSSLVTIDYTNQSGKASNTSQVVNYNYVNGNSSSGVNFSGSLEVNGTAGSTKYVVGYIYAGGASGSLYTGVNLVSSNSSARINGGFINNQEVATNQVIAVEFAVAVQNTTNSYVNITPTWSNSANISATSVANGAPLSLSIVPAQNAVNYIFGNIPILEATPSTIGSISVVNNGNANGTAITVEKSGSESAGITVDASDCTTNIPQANGAGSCDITYTVTTYTPGSATLIYKSNNVEVGSQVVYWMNEYPLPVVETIPVVANPNLNHGESIAFQFNVNNFGNAPLTNLVITPVLSGGATLPESATNDCGSSLGVDSACVINGNLFGAVDGTGVLYFIVQGNYDDTDYSFVSLPIRYTVLGAPQLNITPAQVVNVTVLANGESLTATTYTAMNNGKARATLDAISLESMTNLNKPTISNSSTCTIGRELAINESCSVIVSYGPVSASVSINESGSTHVLIDYHGGTPNVTPQAVSESYNYNLVGNDTYVEESTTVHGLTGTNPYSGNALIESMYIDIEYTNPSVNYDLTNFNLNTNNLPFGMLVDSNASTCKTGSEVMTLAKDASCNLRVKLDKGLLSQSSQGGSVVLNFMSPKATWSTPLGVYTQPSATTMVINYLQPTVSFSLSDNADNFESTVLSAILTNRTSGVSPFTVDISGVSDWLESEPVALTNNCTVNPTSYGVSCNLASGSELARIRYFMPTYFNQFGKLVTIPLFYSTTNNVYLSPMYSVIQYINYLIYWQMVGGNGFSAGSAELINIALNQAGTPYVSYQDEVNSNKAVVMTFNGNTWVAVGAPGIITSTVYDLNLALDGLGVPYLAYRSGDAKISVLKYNAGSWGYVGNQSFTPTAGDRVSFVFDKTNIPYVAYRSEDTAEAVVMKYQAGSWVAVGDPDGFGGTIGSTSLAFDHLNIPYLAYQSLSSNEAFVMKFNETDWINVGESGASTGEIDYPSLAINSLGTPYLAYVDVANGDKATVMKFDGVNWVSVGELGFSPGAINYPSLSINKLDVPYLAYQDLANGNKATVMKFDGATWVYVGESGFSPGSAEYTGLAINESGMPYVVYSNGNNAGKVTVMKYAK